MLEGHWCTLAGLDIIALCRLDRMYEESRHSAHLLGILRQLVLP